MDIDSLICRGLQDASGLSAKKQKASEEGNVQLQAKALAAQGFNFGNYLGVMPYWGTLNFYVGVEDVDPITYSETVHADPALAQFDRQFDPRLTLWDTKFFDIKWHDDKASENLFFLKGAVSVEGAEYPCCIYFPNPMGGAATYHPSTILEVIAPPISFPSGKSYGQRATLTFPEGSLVMTARTQPPTDPGNTLPQPV